jgi:hypothetical protein
LGLDIFVRSTVRTGRTEGSLHDLVENQQAAGTCNTL